LTYAYRLAYSYRVLRVNILIPACPTLTIPLSIITNRRVRLFLARRKFLMKVSVSESDFYEMESAICMSLKGGIIRFAHM
jgi:hypothetical protein